ncbi:MAG: DUF255 domain-containing protein [Bacteroidetes bacterium]|nr:MAG: DUF255 domain-containing protein [Bacteroidota bacterium]
MRKLLLFILMSWAVSDAGAQANFIKSQDWDGIRKEAAAAKKLIFLDAYTDWCGWCKVMDKKTFADSGIGAFMNQHFINLKLEMEKEDLGIQLALKYGITSFPTYLVFNSDGELVYQTVGYQEVSVFQKTLNEMVSPDHHVKRPGYTPKFNLYYPEFYLLAMQGNGKKKFPTDTLVQAWFNMNSDLSQEINWTVFSRFVGQMDEAGLEQFWETKPSLDSLYGRDKTDDIAGTILGSQIQRLAKSREPDRAEKLLKERLPLLQNGAESGFYYRLYLYKEMEVWAEVKSLLDKRFADKGMDDANWWNTQAWDVYENSNDEALLASALTWIDAVCKENKDYNYLDTHAALLKKAGKLDEAEKKAEEAIEVGKANGNNVLGTVKLLDEIRKAKP